MTPMTKICLTLIVAISIVLAFMGPSYERGRRARELAAQQVDTLAVIQRILDGGDLPRYWPGAARTMKRMADVFEIDPYLLPTISRVENCDPRRRNPYGLCVRGKVAQFQSYTYATYCCAEMLAHLAPVYAGERGPNIKALSTVYCPENAENWAEMMTSIYQTAIK